MPIVTPLIKKELRKIGYGLLYIILSIWIISILNLGMWGLIGFLFISSTIMQLYIAFRTRQRPRIKAFLWTYLYIGGIVILLAYLGKFGVSGYILGIIIICAALLIKKRKQYFNVKHRIETMLFGKPLYKYREEGKKPPIITIGR